MLVECSMYIWPWYLGMVIVCVFSPGFSSRTKSHSVEGVKEKLLQFLLQHSSSMLMSTGCPIEKVGTISVFLIYVFLFFSFILLYTI